MCLSGASAGGRGLEGGFERRQDARAAAGLDRRDASLDALDVVGRVQLRRRHDPLEGRVEGDHAERVLGLQQSGGLDGGLAGHRQSWRRRHVAAPPPVQTSMLPERSITRNSARLPCCGSIGGSAETGSRSSSTRALVAARRERARAADHDQPAPQVLDERLQRALLVEAQAGSRGIDQHDAVVVGSARWRSGRQAGGGLAHRPADPGWSAGSTSAVGVAGSILEHQHLPGRFDDDDGRQRAGLVADAAARRGPARSPGPASARAGSAACRLARGGWARRRPSSDPPAAAAARRRPAPLAGRAARRCGRPRGRPTERSACGRLLAAAVRRLELGRGTYETATPDGSASMGCESVVCQPSVSRTISGVSAHRAGRMLPAMLSAAVRSVLAVGNGWADPASCARGPNSMRRVAARWQRGDGATRPRCVPR